MDYAAEIVKVFEEVEAAHGKLARSAVLVAAMGTKLVAHLDAHDIGCGALEQEAIALAGVAYRNLVEASGASFEALVPYGDRVSALMDAASRAQHAEALVGYVHGNGSVN